MNKIGLVCAFAVSVIQIAGAVLVIRDAESKAHISHGIFGFSISLIALMYLAGVFA